MRYPFLSEYDHHPWLTRWWSYLRTAISEEAFQESKTDTSPWWYFLWKWVSEVFQLQHHHKLQPNQYHFDRGLQRPVIPWSLSHVLFLYPRRHSCVFPLSSKTGFINVKRPEKIPGSSFCQKSSEYRERSDDDHQTLQRYATSGILMTVQKTE